MNTPTPYSCYSFILEADSAEGLRAHPALGRLVADLQEMVGAGPVAEGFWAGLIGLMVELAAAAPRGGSPGRSDDPDLSARLREYLAPLAALGVDLPEHESRQPARVGQGYPNAPGSEGIGAASCVMEPMAAGRRICIGVDVQDDTAHVGVANLAGAGRTLDTSRVRELAAPYVDFPEDSVRFVLQCGIPGLNLGGHPREVIRLMDVADVQIPRMQAEDPAAPPLLRR